MSSFDEVLCAFDSLVQSPEEFVSHGTLANQAKCVLRNTYNLSHVDSFSKNALPELLIENFDDEQIWQELEILNQEVIHNFFSKVAKVIVEKDKLQFPFHSGPIEEVNGEDSPESNDEDEDDVDSEEEIDESFGKEVLGDLEEDSEEDDTDNEEIEDSKSFKNKRNSEVDDKFFKLSEMEEFLDKCEKMSSDDEDEVDYFFGEGSEVGDETIDQPNYSDFFKPPEESSTTKITKNNKTNSGEESDFSSSEEVEKDEEKSQLEVRDERLKKQIAKLEAEALEERPWQLKGEVSATARPINSLLEEVVEFDLTQRPPPVIVEQVTHQLEDIILQRIRDKAYDDVERKIKVIDTPMEFKQKLVLNQEKSKLSLAEIYEQEYIKQRDEKGKKNDEPERQPEHVQIENMMNSLFKKLDALSNFHYTPKPSAPELKIVTNSPAVTMEEVAPVTSTDANLLAPEEVAGKAKQHLLGKSERTDTDKKRERRKKKALMAKKMKKQKTLNTSGLKSIIESDKTKLLKAQNVSELSTGGDAIKTSKQFFTQLDETQSSKHKSSSKRPKFHVTNAKKFKL